MAIAVDLVSGLHAITPNDVLSSTYEIEDALLVIHDLDAKIQHLKGLKQHRNRILDNQVNNLNTTVETLRSIIMNTMQQLAPDKKTLNFPAVGKTTRRKPTESWQIDDEQQMLTYLESKGVKDRVIKEIKEILDKKQLNGVLDDLTKGGKSVPGVQRVIGSESLSVSFDAAIGQKAQERESTLQDGPGTSIEEMEALEV